MKKGEKCEKGKQGEQNANQSSEAYSARFPPLLE
jgi:hypothetical protein